MRDLKGRAVLITGAGSGIGRAAAVAFAREGADPLILDDINPAGLEETAAMLEPMHQEVFKYTADVSDFEAVREMVDDAIVRAGRIDVLVNVAGTGVMAPLECYDIADWRLTIDVNLWGPINTVFCAFPHMAARGSGHIVNIASISGLWSDMIYMAPYITSKFGVVGFSEALLMEGHCHGIGVTCICPGVVRTPIYESAAIKGFKPEMRGLYRFLSRLGEEPEDTARTIVKAVRKNRFLVVTTPFSKVDYFIRRHFRSVAIPSSKVLFRGLARFLEKYRTEKE